MHADAGLPVGNPHRVVDAAEARGLTLHGQFQRLAGGRNGNLGPQRYWRAPVHEPESHVVGVGLRGAREVVRFLPDALGKFVEEEGGSIRGRLGVAGGGQADQYNG